MSEKVFKIENLNDILKGKGYEIKLSDATINAYFTVSDHCIGSANINYSEIGNFSSFLRNMEEGYECIIYFSDMNELRSAQVTVSFVRRELGKFYIVKTSKLSMFLKCMKNGEKGFLS